VLVGGVIGRFIPRGHHIELRLRRGRIGPRELRLAPDGKERAGKATLSPVQETGGI